MIKKLVTGAQLDDETSNFYIHCLVKGEEAYDKFQEERLVNKSKDLFETIPMTWSSVGTENLWKPPAVNKETINFLRMVDYARLWEFDIDYLLTHEVSSTSFYLAKDGNLPKSMKSKLARELKKYLGEPYPT